MNLIVGSLPCWLPGLQSTLDKPSDTVGGLTTSLTHLFPRHSIPLVGPQSKAEKQKASIILTRLPSLHSSLSLQRTSAHSKYFLVSRMAVKLLLSMAQRPLTHFPGSI